jgi:hypothetical protein
MALTLSTAYWDEVVEEKDALLDSQQVHETLRERELKHLVSTTEEGWEVIPTHSDTSVTSVNNDGCQQRPLSSTHAHAQSVTTIPELTFSHDPTHNDSSPAQSILAYPFSRPIPQPTGFPPFPSILSQVNTSFLDRRSLMPMPPTTTTDLSPAAETFEDAYLNSVFEDHEIELDRSHVSLLWRSQERIMKEDDMIIDPICQLNRIQPHM